MSKVATPAGVGTVIQEDVVDGVAIVVVQYANGTIRTWLRGEVVYWQAK